MSRFRRVAHNVASGYAALAGAALCALVSVPIALHYLSNERFALWALMTSIGGYLALVDLGMSGSVARLLIDHKDERESGVYGSLVKTGWLVLVTQGACIFLAGFGLAPLLCRALAITPALQREFILLLDWQSAALALVFASRIFSHLLHAHQRLDIVNYAQIASLLLNLALMWIFFQAGQGVFSLAWAAILSSLAGALICLAACWRLGLFPPAGAWGRASWEQFRAIFAYGKDLFLVAVGTQLIVASQAMLITRQLGLEAAALWTVGTRAFSMLSQAVWRVSDMSGPAFSEMLVRGEQALLRERYRSVVMVTASLSGFVAVGYALCNSLFVTVWTSHKMYWPAGNDVLLAFWMIIMAVLHCHNCFVLLTKQIGFMRYVYFIEGLVFVTAALVTARWGGLAAVIGCSILCSGLFSGLYGLIRVSRYFQYSLYEVGVRWLLPMGRVLLFLVPVALGAWWVCRGLENPGPRLACHALLGGSAGSYFFLRYGLTHTFQRELMERAPKSFNPLLRRVFVACP